MRPELLGIDLVDFSMRMSHGFMAAAWLLLDFIVYWLHFGVKDPKRPIDVRIERAEIMHGIDTIVAYIFILMMPTGLALTYITGTNLFTEDWLNWKHVLYAIIIICAFVLFPVSGIALRNLQAIQAAGEAIEQTTLDRLNHEIKRAMNVAMPVVFVIWILIAVISILSFLNIKTPEDQEFIFRKTAQKSATVAPAIPLPSHTVIYPSSARGC